MNIDWGNFMSNQLLSLLIGSSLSALATGLGALPVLFFQETSHRFRDILLAFTAGIMMAAATFSLIPSSLREGGLTSLTLGLFSGVIMLLILEKYTPHIELEHKQVAVDGKALLIILAITLHNIPEGLSVGVSYGSEVNSSLGGLIAVAIGLQNAPEGLLIALFLIQQRIDKYKALAISTLTGLIEIVAGLIGYFAVQWVQNLVGYGLAFASGAMIFIIYKELIPESHGHGHARGATVSFVGGMLIMIYLIQYFG
ncbi:MAG: dihydroorotate dehydrogenase [Bacillales bacterium]|jgi:ZIP family zinc transporter|nr:dihydroorotate dehydrogenase [Bacillales bacterium]